MLKKYPLTLWLYLYLTPQPTAIVPRIELLFWEGVRASIPEPTNWFQRLLHQIVISEVDRIIALHSQLIDLNVLLVGQILINPQEVEDAMALEYTHSADS